MRIGGVGGYGADPLAIITEPLWLSAITVFRLIAPANTSMARSNAVSLRDIECLQGKKPRKHYIHSYTNVKRLTARVRSEKYTPT